MSSTALENNCTLLIHTENVVGHTEQDLQKGLENKDDKVKIQALKDIIICTLNGQPLPKLLMAVIKFTLHSQNHVIKKLCLMYWEVVEKREKSGKLLHEMILVCNAMKNNLEHPNEYIRGSTLRFLCYLKEAEVLESGMLPSITANLEHRHSYVRKNAVLCVYTIYENFPELIPDAPELVEQFLYAETNPSAKRNAFLMLINCAPDKAVAYLASIVQDVASQSEGFQLLILDLIRQVCRANPLVKSQYIQCIFQLVNSPANAVAFEGANTLVSLSNAPTAVRAAVTAYCQLLGSESDNNIKLVILSRLSALKKRSEKVLQEMLMDIMRTLSSPNIDVRRATLTLTLSLVSPRNAEDVVGLLKKEVQKTQAGGGVKGQEEYRKLLVDAMHKCAVKFPEVVPNVVHLLMNYLGDDDAASALDVMFFVREIVEEYPALRNEIVTKLIECFEEIRASSVYRVGLWVLGEYACDDSVQDLALTMLRELIGPLPLLAKPAPKADAEGEDGDGAGEGEKKTVAAGPTVLSDGTYAMSSAHVSGSGADDAKAADEANSNLRALLLGGDFFLGSAVVSSLVKITMRFAQHNGWGSPEANEEIAKTTLLATSLLRLGGPGTEKRIDSDSHQRLVLCIKLLLDPEKHMQMFMGKNREAFGAMLKDKREKESAGLDADQKVVVHTQADDLIKIRQLNKMAADFMDDEDADLTRALGNKSARELSKLNRVFQLTGFADVVYAEAQLTVLDYDIMLDILVVNQTANTLQNLVVELNTSGDLKVMERPLPQVLKPNGTLKLSAGIKVTSTESGVIFGNIVFDSQSGTQQTVVVMNNIHMDVMDYIKPDTTTDAKFRSMWAEFEWENKVEVKTDIDNLNTYLNHIAGITNMKCLTDDKMVSGSCQFLAANLYARSIFGEDALLNMSVENNNGKIVGFIRIRSKTQGIALSLGDKITAQQRGPA